MNPSKLYIPNPEKWVRFYKALADGKIKHHTSNQAGGGNATHKFITPIDQYVKHSQSEPQSRQPPVKVVSTSEQAVDQAKSELQRKGESIKELQKAARQHKRKGRRRGNVIKKVRKGNIKKQKRVVKRKSKPLKRRKKNQTGGKRKKNKKKTNTRRGVKGKSHRTIRGKKVETITRDALGF